MEGFIIKKNKKKIAIAVIAVLVLIALVALLVWVNKGNQPTIGNNTNVIEDTESNNTVDNSTTDKDITEEVPSISDIPVAPDNSEDENNETIDKSEAEKFPGEDNEPTKVPTQVPTEAPVEPTVAPTPTEKPEVTVTPTPGVTEAPVEPTKAPTEAPTATPTPGVTVTPTPTPTEKPAEPTATPTPTTKPDSSIKVIWQGKDYPENEAGYGEGKDITLDTIGITIPSVDEFNDFGVGENGTGWVGDKTAEEQFLVDVLDDVAWALIDKEVISNHNQAFLYTNYNIGFSYTSGSSDFYLERDPATDTYTLTINRDLKSDYLSLMQADYAAYNRDIVKVLCSIFSSTPNELYDAIYDTIHGDNDMPISLNTWGSIDGVDCLGRINYDACQKGHYVFEFKSK